MNQTLLPAWTHTALFFFGLGSHLTLSKKLLRDYICCTFVEGGLGVWGVCVCGGGGVGGSAEFYGVKWCEKVQKESLDSGRKCAMY